MNGDAYNFRDVQELLAAFYGAAFVTQPIESDYTVGTSALAIGSNPSGVRVGFSLSNTGSTNIAIALTAGLTIATGFLLLPGGFLSFDWYYDGDIVSRPRFAIGSAAGGTLHMEERFLTGA